MSEEVLSETDRHIGRSIGAIVLAMPQAWAGGKLRVMQLRTR